MKIWCTPYKNLYKVEPAKYDVSIRRMKDGVSVSFNGQGNGLSIPLDTATRIAHALLAAGSEDFKASWSVNETSRPATQT